MRITHPINDVWLRFNRRFRDTFWAGFMLRNRGSERFWDRFDHQNEATK